jgi:hypothetical protein
MRAIDIAISTVWRPEAYLEGTLESLGSGVRLRLVAGTPVDSHLVAYHGNDNYEIVDAPQDEWDTIRDKAIWHRASWNYWRCLVCSSSHANGVILFEDDIKVAVHWRERLERTIEAIETSYGQDYVLAMYSPYSCDGYKRGLLFEHYRARGFFGTQGMYYPEKIRVNFASYLYSHGVLAYKKPYDWLLRDYVSDAGIQLLSTTPSLVQHTGISTTGLGGIFHQAPSFLDEV